VSLGRPAEGGGRGGGGSRGARPRCSLHGGGLQGAPGAARGRYHGGERAWRGPQRRSDVEQGSPSAAGGNLDSSSSVLIRSHPPSICRPTSSICPLPPRRQLRETMEEGAAELTPSITGPAVEATLLVPVEAAVEADARCRRRGKSRRRTRGRGGRAVEAGEGGERG
jgi:hypothetical protein